MPIIAFGADLIAYVTLGRDLVTVLGGGPEQAGQPQDAESTTPPTADETPAASPATSSPPASEVPPTASSASSPAPPGSSTSSPDPEVLDRSMTDARIEVTGSTGKVGPNQFKAGTSPGFEPHIYTASGRLGRNDGCYVSWTIYSNGVVVDRQSTPGEKRGGFSDAYWPNHVRLAAGTAGLSQM